VVVVRPQGLSHREQDIWLRQGHRAYIDSDKDMLYFSGLNAYVCRCCQGPTPWLDLCDACASDPRKP
jgi:hypothetical protein